MKEITEVSAYIPLLLVVGALIGGLAGGVDLMESFGVGVANGLRVCRLIFPNILLMLTAISVFRAAGGVALFCDLVKPLFTLVGIPPETGQIVLLRPFSGAGALALAKEIMSTYGVDSYIGRIAAVMLGASETSIYTIGVYTGFLGLKKTRHLLISALFADFVAFLAAVWCVRLFFG